MFFHVFPTLNVIHRAVYFTFLFLASMYYRRSEHQVDSPFLRGFGLCFLEFGLDCCGQNGSGGFPHVVMHGQILTETRVRTRTLPVFDAHWSSMDPDVPSLFQNRRTVEEDPRFQKA